MEVCKQSSSNAAVYDEGDGRMIIYPWHMAMMWIHVSLWVFHEMWSFTSIVGQISSLCCDTCNLRFGFDPPSQLSLCPQYVFVIWSYMLNRFNVVNRVHHSTMGPKYRHSYTPTLTTLVRKRLLPWGAREHFATSTTLDSCHIGARRIDVSCAIWDDTT
jgi:hypothetical protein